MAEEIITVFKAETKDYETKLRILKEGLSEAAEGEKRLYDQTLKNQKILKQEIQDLQELKRRRDDAMDPREVSEYNKRINETVGRIESLSQAVGDASNSLGEYAEAQEKTTEATSRFAKIGQEAFGLLDRLTFGLAGKMKGLFTSIGTVTKGMNLLKAAIIGTGIGALVVAVGTLIAYFTQSQRGADQLSRIMKTLGAAVKVVTDRAIAVGESLVNAFKNPKQAIIDFGNAIKDFIIRRIQETLSGVKGLGQAIKLVFEGEFTKAAEAAKNAAIDLGSGLTLVGGIVRDNADAIAELTAEIQAEAKAAFELEAANQRLRDAQIALNVERANSRALIKELNLIAEDVSRSEEERIGAAQRALSIEQALLQKRQELAQENVRIIREQNALGENTIEDTERLAEAEIELANIREESLELQTTINNKINAIKQTAAAEEKRRLQEQLALEKAAFDLAVQLIEEQSRMEFLATEELYLNKQLSQEEYNQKSLEIETNRITQLQTLYDEESLQYQELQNEKLRIQDQYERDAEARREKAAKEELRQWEELDAIIDKLEQENEREAEERAQREADQRAQALDQAVQLSQQITGILVEQQQEEIARLEEQERRQEDAHDKELDRLFQQLESARGAERKKLLAEIEAAKERQELEREQTAFRKEQEKERLKNLQKAELIALTIAEAVAVARAFSDLGPIGGSIAAAALLVKFAVLYNQIDSQEFAEGTDYVRPANSNQGKDVDDIPAWLTKGEAVIPVESNRKNRGLVKSLVQGNVDDFIRNHYLIPAMQNRVMNSVSQKTQTSIEARFNDQNMIRVMREDIQNNSVGFKMVAKAITSNKRHLRDAA